MEPSKKMDKIKHIKSLLGTIRSSEGNGFACNEDAIFGQYNKKEDEKVSLAIKILSVIGGLLACFAFIGVLFILEIFDSEWSSMILGILLIGTAIFVNKKVDTLIVDTFSVSIYVLGLVLFVVGLLIHNMHQDHVALLVILIALSSLFFTQNYILSFISVITIGTTLLFFIISQNIPDIIHGFVLFYTTALAYCFISEASLLTAHPKLSKLYGPLRIGLIFSLLFGLIAIGKNGLVHLTENLIWISSLASLFFIGFLVFRILKILGIQSVKNKFITYGLTIVVLLPTLFAPAIAGALLIVLLSFFVNYKTGLAIGLISLVYFVSLYYYDLNLSLLTKSIILFSSGVVFLVFYLIFNKKTNSL